MADRHILYTLDMKGNLAPKSKELAGNLRSVGKEAKETEKKVGDLRKLVASFGGDITSTGGRLINLAQGVSGLSGSLGKLGMVMGGTALAVTGLAIGFMKLLSSAAETAREAGEAEKRIRNLGLVSAEAAAAAKKLGEAHTAAMREIDAATVNASARNANVLSGMTTIWGDIWAAIKTVRIELQGFIGDMMMMDVFRNTNTSTMLSGFSTAGQAGFGVLKPEKYFAGASEYEWQGAPDMRGVLGAGGSKSKGSSFSLPSWMSAALTGNASMMANLNSSIMAGQSAATLGSFTNAPTGASGVAAAMARGQQANFAAAGIGSIAPPPGPFLPGFGKTLGAGVGGLASGFSTVAAGGNIAPGLLGMLGGPAGMLASTLAGQLTSKGGDIGKMTDGLIDQAKAVPTIVKGIVEAVPDIITALIEAAPEILQSLVKVLIELPIILIKGIGEAIRDMFTTTDAERATRAANDASRGTIRGRSGYIEDLEERRNGGGSRSVVVNINGGDTTRVAHELRKALGPYGRGASLSPLAV